MTNAVIIAQQGSNNTTFRNRIINGAMVIDQRNAGASVTVNSSANTFGVDRWYGYGQPTDGVFTIQQSTDTPTTGFINSTKLTVTTADSSIGATQIYRFTQSIEGLNCADLSFGSASAATVTLSFWVKSSLTGTFGGNLANSGFSRAYPFTFTINAANTWEQKSISIAGDTTGTWLTTNGIGISISFVLGMGSTYVGTANAWNAGLYFGPTGGTNIIATNAATFYITGVQLEAGSTASPFENRSYGVELQLCQRYYQKSYNQSSAPGAATPIGMISLIVNGTAGTNYCQFTFPVPMRTAATISIWDGAGNSGKCSKYQAGAWTNNLGTIAAANIGESGYSISFDGTPFTTGIPHGTHYAASAEL